MQVIKIGGFYYLQVIKLRFYNLHAIEPFNQKILLVASADTKVGSLLTNLNSIYLPLCSLRTPAEPRIGSRSYPVALLDRQIKLSYGFLEPCRCLREPLLLAAQERQESRGFEKQNLAAPTLMDGNKKETT
ncbi:MAG: hypothetical protein K8F91_06970 [Candidatus Obscuribacterales bacterium]|nr:hypothetical protein [Candidatus Obscuribacterales bacterium]